MQKLNRLHLHYMQTLEVLSNYSDSDQYYYTGRVNSPPSPVSSSYSELRQATRVPPGYHLQQQMALLQQQRQQQNFETASSSHYEPIQGPSSNKLDFFGHCHKCRHKIIGEGTGCEANGRLYHVQCFTCHHCQCLLQGQPFYSIEGKPFCREGYLNTFEKCCKCFEPIMERILRATGKPYHPQCFSCLVCSQTLDGIPFTVDATNQIHCIPCFHKEFAPKCSVCRQPIMPEPHQGEAVRVVALDRSFHVNCYRCEDCGILLSSEEQGGNGCYPLDDRAFCKNCNTRRIQEITSYPLH